MSVAKRSSGAVKLCWIWHGKSSNPKQLRSYKPKKGYRSDDGCACRMENSVLGNALEGVPEEDEEEDKPKDPNIESTEGIDGEEMLCRADVGVFMAADVFFPFGQRRPGMSSGFRCTTRWQKKRTKKRRKPEKIRVKVQRSLKVNSLKQTRGRSQTRMSVRKKRKTGRRQTRKQLLSGRKSLLLKTNLRKNQKKS